MPSVDSTAPCVIGPASRRPSSATPEDGRLEAGPITQGAVDSTLGIFLKVPKQGSQEAWYWIVAGEDWFRVNTLNKRVEERLPEDYPSRADKHWRYRLNQACTNFADP